jgi:hypothetical protein
MMTMEILAEVTVQKNKKWKTNGADGATLKFTSRD